MTNRILLLTWLLVAAAGPARADGVRAQVDTVGFATRWSDLVDCLDTARAQEALPPLDDVLGAAETAPWIAAILPHDDYLYAAKTVAPMLPGLQARTWVVFGVCHACRRLGVSDTLLFDDYDAWRVAGVEVPVAVDLRARLLAALPADMATVDRERQAAEHSIEALLPWLRAVQPDVRVVPILVPGMSLERMREVGGAVARELAAACRENGWQPGRDLGVVISADAVHYGCEGWGERGYHPYGCTATGHATARGRDVMLAEATLAGPLTPEGPARFHRLVCDESRPSYPYRITWCGVYSIPFGLTVVDLWREALGGPPLAGDLVRYGDSLSDGRLRIPGSGLGVTAPSSLAHWVGYPAVGYR